MTQKGKIEKLEKLCRALQAERRKLKKELEANDKVSFKLTTAKALCFATTTKKTATTTKTLYKLIRQNDKTLWLRKRCLERKHILFSAPARTLTITVSSSFKVSRQTILLSNKFHHELNSPRLISVPNFQFHLFLVQLYFPYMCEIMAERSTLM